MGTARAWDKTQRYSLTYSLLQRVILILETPNLYSYEMSKYQLQAWSCIQVYLFFYTFDSLKQQQWKKVVWWPSGHSIFITAPVQVFPEEPEKATCWQGRQTCKSIWHFKIIFFSPIFSTQTQFYIVLQSVQRGSQYFPLKLSSKVRQWHLIKYPDSKQNISWKDNGFQGNRWLPKEKEKKKRELISDSKYLLKPDQLYWEWDAVRVMSRGQQTGAA